MVGESYGGDKFAANVKGRLSGKIGIARRWLRTFLLVSDASTRAWLIRLMAVATRWGLGAFPSVSLLEARGRALGVRKVVRLDRVDLLRVRREAEAAKARESAGAHAEAINFMDVAAESSPHTQDCSPRRRNWARAF